MWGAIIGDLAGSIYEYDQFKEVSSICIDKIIMENSFFSDDTILTIAILDAILNDKNYGYYLKLYGNKYFDYKPNTHPYFDKPFSPGFCKWLKGNYIGKSAGNGAMMRIASVGYLFDNIDDVILNAKNATVCSHNTNEAIECSRIVALIIYLARCGYSKEDIIDKLNIKLVYKNFEKFNSTCYNTIDNCLYALFTSNSFDESIRKVISYGGDTDTNACIVGSMAEVLFGIDDKLINLAKEKVPFEFVDKLNIGYKKIRKL